MAETMCRKCKRPGRSERVRITVAGCTLAGTVCYECAETLLDSAWTAPSDTRAVTVVEPEDGA